LSNDGLVFSFPGQREIDCCSLIQLALNPGAPRMARDDAAHVGKTDPRPLKFVASVQPLEYTEKFIGVTLIETHAVVADVKHVFLRFRPRPDLDAGAVAGLGEFDRV